MTSDNSLRKWQGLKRMKEKLEKRQNLGNYIYIFCLLIFNKVLVFDVAKSYFSLVVETYLWSLHQNSPAKAKENSIYKAKKLKNSQVQDLPGKFIFTWDFLP